MKLAIAMTGMIDVPDDVDVDTLILDTAFGPVITLKSVIAEGEMWCIETEIEEASCRMKPSP